MTFVRGFLSCVCCCACLTTAIVAVTNRCVGASEPTAVRIIIVGAAGKQGREHFTTLNGNGYSVVAVVDSCVDGLSSYDSGVRKYQSFAALQEDPELPAYDGAIVCVPHSEHKDLALALLSHGKIVVKEKPLAMTPDDLPEITDRVFAGGKLFTIVQRQFNPNFRLARELLINRRIGDIKGYQYVYSLNVPLPKGWRADRSKTGGGVLMDMGYHVIDMIVSMFGTPSGVLGARKSYFNEEFESLDIEGEVLADVKHGDFTGRIHLEIDESKSKVEQLDIRGTGGRVHVTPTSVALFDEQDVCVESFSGSCNIKDMFDEYFRRQDDAEYVRAHLRHHATVVVVIADIYGMCKSIGVE